MHALSVIHSYVVMAFTGTQQAHTLHHDGDGRKDTQPPHRPDILNAAVLLKQQEHEHG